MQLLCHPVHSHLLYVKTISTKHVTLVSCVSFPACSTSDMFQNSQIHFSHGSDDSCQLSNDFVRHAQVQFKSQISNPRFPLLLFTLSHTPTKNYTTVLLLSQDTLQSLVVQDVQPTWPKVLKGNPPGSTTPNPSCSQTPSLPKKVPRPT